ncbi:Dipeptide transport system permease protein DppB [Roseivivax jejudonensis]|uniref:Dipeptide transport system permease protein DppB n=2 Tax=Roseivivax jejudonensis TaxID=1529041 RepID=A0A1X6ZWB7_9RHOB|nr:ABC transporter permease [Roseivivax jejudonensis]SLN63282.1 Dipeptide transport system permease protein DppB [Roseivivax jejudonensis]
MTTVVTLFGVALVVFVVIRLAPGDPIAMMLPPGADAEDMARLRAAYGLDRSVPEQFLIWLGGVVRGDFGTSISLRQDVGALVLDRLPATLELALLALAIAVAIGTTLAVIGTLRRQRPAESAVDLWNGMTLSIPDFLWGLIFILLFGVVVPLFPVSGRISPALDPDYATGFLLVESLLRLDLRVTGDLLHHMALPALALALPLSAVIAQVLKQSLKEVMHLDYVTLARAKGYSEIAVLFREALRNAVLPTLTLVGVQFTFLIGGTVIVEKLFSYGGLGNLAIDAVINRDLPLIQGIVLLFAVLFIATNLIVDLAYAALNPRLRHG